MKKSARGKIRQLSHYAVAVFCAGSLISDPRLVLGQVPEAQTSPAPAPTDESQKIPNDQLDSLVAPIALYPDPLLAQTLAASTYPLEIIQLQQWLERNKDLKGQALEDAVIQQNWDPSIQAMVGVPEVLNRLAGNVQWTTSLGNAFLAQPSDVMAAVQRMRAKAQANGALKTGTQQVVETQTVESQQVIIIEQANPQVIYVPSYDPVVVYGSPIYPYPSYVYPGYVPGMALAFGAGLALGAAWGGGWGWGCGWGHGDVNINVNNNYVNRYNKVNNINGGGKWQHNVNHRGAAPYGDRGTANRYGGNGRQNPGGIGGAGGAGGAGRPGGAGGIGGAGGAGNPGGIGGAGGANRPGGAGGAGNPGGIGGAGGANRPGGAGGSSGFGGGGAGRPSTLPSSGSDRIGNRAVSPGSGQGGGRSAFGSGGFNGGSTRNSSARGGQSMGGGGFQRPGGGGGGGRAGGGGRR